MIATGKIWKTQLRSVLLYFGSVLLFLIFAALTYQSLKHKGDIAFVDARVYARAMTTWKAGGNPYSTYSEALPFVYPPVFLNCVAVLGKVLPRGSWFVYLIAAGFGLLVLPFILTTFYIRSRWLSPFLAMVLFTFQPMFTEEHVFLTGNITNLFYPLALAAGIPGIRRNKWLWFYLVVAIASLAKPTFLDLLVLPLLAGERQLGRIAVCVGTVLSAFAFQKIAMPRYYAAFQQNVFTEVFVKGDTGFNVFNYLHKQGQTFALLRNPSLLLAIHAAIIGVILASLFFLRKRKDGPAVVGLWVPALLVVAILANPRMQPIDAAIAILPALYLCIECVRRLPATSVSLAGAGIAFTVFEFLTVKQFEMGLLLLLYSSVFLVIFLLQREELAVAE
jgi:hypothetical protein